MKRRFILVVLLVVALLLGGCVDIPAGEELDEEEGYLTERVAYLEVTLAALTVDGGEATLTHLRELEGTLQNRINKLKLEIEGLEQRIEDLEAY